MTGPEPVTRSCPRPVRHPVLRQVLVDAVLAHWEVAPAAVVPHLPPGIRPDTWEGRAYVGLVGVRMVGVRPPGLPTLPHLGTFAQVNVRVYGVDPDGRRGVVFCSLDAARLVPALVGRAGGLAYRWSAVRSVREGDVLGYAVRRRALRAGAGRTGRPVGGSLVVRTGAPVEPTPLDDFLTARWGLFVARGGRTWHCPLDHSPWLLGSASVVTVDAGLVRSAGFVVGETPDGLAWSRGVTARFGHPAPVTPNP
jgi:uncharacterized protein